MQDDVYLLREVTIDQAADFIVPNGPRFVERIETIRNDLRSRIENFCSAKSGGTLWLYRSTTWGPKEVFVGVEGVALQICKWLA